MKYFVLSLLMLCGCSHTPKQETVRCFSGGVEIYNGTSSDKVKSVNGLHQFTCANTGKTFTIDAECIISK